MNKTTTTTKTTTAETTAPATAPAVEPLRLEWSAETGKVILTADVGVWGMGVQKVVETLKFRHTKGEQLRKADFDSKSAWETYTAYTNNVYNAVVAVVATAWSKAVLGGDYELAHKKAVANAVSVIAIEFRKLGISFGVADIHAIMSSTLRRGYTVATEAAAVEANKKAWAVWRDRQTEVNAAVVEAAKARKAHGKDSAEYAEAAEERDTLIAEADKERKEIAADFAKEYTVRFIGERAFRYFIEQLILDKLTAKVSELTTANAEQERKARSDKAAPRKEAKTAAEKALHELAAKNQLTVAEVDEK